ncbi:MAG: sulfatase-like hydrolase/transferase, partial [Opitutales bacterium]|nr:sulfatase-like hydrolase/transferase [Opitutales bacterium]
MKQIMRIILFILGTFLALNTFAKQLRPNIVLIMCDDLGYGDVQCLNPKHGKIKTPHIDRLAGEGMVFTDAHSGSAVCTPTRYGLLTGRYSWRTRLQSGVVQGFAPCLIAPDRLTVASLLKKQGYETGIIGKWHLDFKYQDAKTGKILPRMKRAPIGSTIPDGPVHRGFDYFHGIHHAGHMDTIIENNKVIERMDEIHNLPRLTEKSVAYIEGYAKSRAQPFFLYVPFTAVHLPVNETEDWLDKVPAVITKSIARQYAACIMHMDHSVGRILKALAEHDLRQNTLIVFTSDNGGSWSENKDLKYPLDESITGKLTGNNKPLRDQKGSIYEGGTRVPTLVSWPGKIALGKNPTPVFIADWMPTFCKLAGFELGRDLMWDGT